MQSRFPRQSTPFAITACKTIYPVSSLLVFCHVSCNLCIALLSEWSLVSRPRRSHARRVQLDYLVHSSASIPWSEQESAHRRRIAHHVHECKLNDLADEMFMKEARGKSYPESSMSLPRPRVLSRRSRCQHCCIGCCAIV